VYGREQVSRALVTGESMEEDDIVMRVGNSLVQRRTDGEGRAKIILTNLLFSTSAIISIFNK